MKKEDETIIPLFLNVIHAEINTYHLTNVPTSFELLCLQDIHIKRITIEIRERKIFCPQGQKTINEHIVIDNSLCDIKELEKRHHFNFKHHLKAYKINEITEGIGKTWLKENCKEDLPYTNKLIIILWDENAPNRKAPNIEELPNSPIRLNDLDMNTWTQFLTKERVQYEIWEQR